MKTRIRRSVLLLSLLTFVSAHFALPTAADSTADSIVVTIESIALQC
ncbi:hypothetical protein [Chroococcidiopsis sp. SAG 2025]|nr:hypothetical protein [Chroococcidiopsis sp. SAG 2025]